MGIPGMLGINFINKFSQDKRSIPFPVSPTMTLADILPELSKKFNIHMQNLTIAVQDSQVLTPDDFKLPISALIEKFGKTFDIIDRNIVGGEPETDAKYGKTLVDELVPALGSTWAQIGPKHPQWQSRIKKEIELVLRYINYLKALHPNQEPWFKLTPSKNPAHKFLIWEGYLLIPSRKEIKFDIKVLLTSDYPKACPRCFAEESILNYCGKLYYGNVWEQDGKKYIMICHDHMAETEAWQPTLGIVHFFIREVWVWWSAQQNFILQQWDEKHTK